MPGMNLPGLPTNQTPWLPKKAKQPDYGNPSKTYPAAVEQQAGDYDRLMKGFQGVLNTPSPGFGDLMGRYNAILSNPGGTASPISAPNIQYNQSADVTKSLSGLENLSQTGGLNEGDISALRARGISPIRSIYANAMRNLDRQRALQGGYSPSYTAATTRMSRELGDQIGEQTNRVNANIAEMVQRGKLSAAPQYASAAGAESGRATDVAARNAQMQFGASEANQRAQMEAANNQQAILNAMQGLYGNEQNRQLSALEQMKSLYGTTPALSSLFGEQAARQTEQGQGQQRINQTQQGINQQRGLALISGYQRGLPQGVINPRNWRT